MQTFRDNAGRTWTVAIDIAAIKRVRSLLDIDLLEVLPGKGVPGRGLGIVDRDPVVVAIGTEGTAPILGQGLRARIDAMLPQELGELAKAASGLRHRVAEAIPPGNRRRGFWYRFFFGDASAAAQP